ncbi:SMC family ATPase, partial [Bacteriovoracaceae bacterium]|nr:SMC family ATPase [Bacteriovoracaceae bacterium]
MKFKKLYLNQITSYRKQTLIDFDQVTHQNLFIISGDTGSGKSTILNSITFALFGKCHQSNINHIDLISLGMPQGEIKLIFQHEDKFYSAEVLIRCKTKSGKILKVPKVSRSIYQRETASINSQIIKSYSTLDEIIDLSFDQFSNSVILNQGKFNQFLFSTFTKRKEILEEFYNSFNLQSISQNLFIELKLLNEKTGNLTSQKENINLQLTQFPDNLVASQNGQLKLIEVKQKQLKTRNSSYNHLSEILNYSEKHHKTNDKFIALQIEVAKINAKLSEESNAHRKLSDTHKIKHQRISAEEQKCLEGIKQENELNIQKQTILGKEAVLKNLENQRRNKRHEQTQDQQTKYDREQSLSTLLKEIGLKKHHTKLKTYFLNKERVECLKTISALNLSLWNKEQEIQKIKSNQQQVQNQIQIESSNAQVLNSAESLVNFDINDKEYHETKERIIELNSKIKIAQKNFEAANTLKESQYSLFEKTETLLNHKVSIKKINFLKDAFNDYLIGVFKNKISHESKQKGECLICHSPIKGNLETNHEEKQFIPMNEFSRIEEIQENIAKLAEMEKEIAKATAYSLDLKQLEKDLLVESSKLKEIHIKIKDAQEIKANLKSIQAICLRYQEQILQCHTITKTKEIEYKNIKNKLKYIISNEISLYKLYYSSGILFKMTSNLDKIEKFL